jgi:SsrA-binding protein
MTAMTALAAPLARIDHPAPMAAPDKKPDEVKVLVRNKKARHEYFVERTIEAGIELRGSEVKSLRDGRASMSDAYALARDGQMYLVQLQINEWPFANYFQHDPKRERRLLLHKREIDELGNAVQAKGYTLLPLELYLKGGRVKVQLGLCKGKQLHDKRATERERDAKREIAREMASRRR